MLTQLESLRCLDPKEYYRLFVDGRFHKPYIGWLGYEEKEPGALQGLYDGFTFLLDNLDLLNRLDASFLCLLHKQVMKGVKTKVCKHPDKSKPGEIRFHEAGFKLFKCTQSGLEEIIEQSTHYGYKNFFIDNHNDGISDIDCRGGVPRLLEVQRKRKFLIYRPYFPNSNLNENKLVRKPQFSQKNSTPKDAIQEAIFAKLQDILFSYNSAIISSNNDNDILTAIARLVKRLELLHPFSDGNCRTFATVLLNGLLIRHSLTPSFLNNPNLDADYSCQEFCDEIRNGQENFLCLAKHPDTTVYDFSTDSCSPEVLAIDKNKTRTLNLTIKEMYFTKVQHFDTEPLVFDLVDLRNLFPNSIKNIPTGTNRLFSKVAQATNEISNGAFYILANFSYWHKNGYTLQKTLEDIYAKGASLVMVRKRDLESPEDLTFPYLAVDDPMNALLIISDFVRTKTSATRVLVTGSVGKTGFKSQLSHVVSKFARVHAREDSANMNLPVASEASSVKKSYDAHITEVAVGSGGGLGAFRSSFVLPDIAVITQLSQCHMDGHKSIENLVKNKASVVKPMKGGLAIINGDMDLAYALKKEISAINTNVLILTFGSSNLDDAQLLNQEFDDQSFGWKVTARIEEVIVKYQVPLLHSHAPLVSVSVLLAAKKLGINVNDAANLYRDFNAYKTMGGLLRIKTSFGEITVYDQSRRGAIEGMKSAFADFRRLAETIKPKRKIACLGSTSIYSDSWWTKQQHHEIGEMINESGIHALFTVGKYTNYIHEKMSDRSVLIADTETENGMRVHILPFIKDGDFLFIMGHGRLNLHKLLGEIIKT